MTQFFKLRPRLHEVLKRVGATGKLFTANQVINFLGKYIEYKKLYDPKDVRMVNFKGDLLQSVFGVEQFIVGDAKAVWAMVFPSLIPATRKEVEDHEANINSADVNASEEKFSKLEHWWMSHLPWWYFVDKKENRAQDNDTATGSLPDQAASTAFVVDTDDEGSNRRASICTTPDHFSVEFEPDSDCSESYANSEADTIPISSEDETDAVLATLEALSEAETTTSNSGTTDTSVDLDIPALEDHWKCTECSLVNLPTTGYCQRCWKLRRNWLPDKLDNGFQPSVSLTRSITVPNPQKTTELPETLFVDPLLQRSISLPTAVGTDVSDGRKRTQSCDESNKNNDENIDRKRTFDKIVMNSKNENDEPPTKLLQRSQLSPSEPVAIATTSSDHHDDNSDESKYNIANTGVCNICHSNPNNSIFVHRKNAHQFCCYKCAKKLQKRGKMCPICRQPIILVLKNFIYTM